MLSYAAFNIGTHSPVNDDSSTKDDPSKIMQSHGIFIFSFKNIISPGTISLDYKNYTFYPRSILSYN